MAIMDDTAVKIDQFHKNELLDRVHCVSTMFDSLVTEHPASADPAVRAPIAEVSERIGLLYQQVGQAIAILPDESEFDMEKINALPEFDAADHLDSDEAIVAFLADFATDEDPVVLQGAIDTVVRALMRRALPVTT